MQWHELLHKMTMLSAQKPCGLCLAACVIARCRASEETTQLQANCKATMQLKSAKTFPQHKHRRGHAHRTRTLTMIPTRLAANINRTVN